MSHSMVDWQTFLSFFQLRVELILLKGYSRHNSGHDDATRYKTAKIPCSFSKHGLIAVKFDEVEKYIGEGHWIGVKIPAGFTLVDCDSETAGKAIATSMQDNAIDTIIFKTHRGYQFLFRDTDRKIKKQNVKQLTLCGVVVDYRIPPSGYTVMPTQNIPERQILMPQATELEEIPDVFLPVRSAKKNESEILELPIVEGERDQQLIAHACRLNNYKAQYRMGFDSQEVLSQFNDLFVVPPVEQSDISRIYTSSLRYPTPEPIVPEVAEGSAQSGNPYFINPNGHLCRWKRNSDGDATAVMLSNFDARIVQEVLEDNGVEQVIKYIMAGNIQNVRLPEIEVPATAFPTMNWLPQWGVRAVIEPGLGTKDYVRHAIQVRSEPVHVVSYAYTGWRKIDEQWVYLSNSGATGMPNVTVKLPKEVQRYCLPTDLKVDEREAIQGSMSFLTVAKKEITIPLYATIWLSTLTTILKPMPNFSVLSYGDSGSQKSTLALLMLSHWGEFDAIHALSNFNDTANQLTERAFKLKDALMVVDDYHPEASRKNSEDKEKTLQRIIREFSNRTGRGRLNSDSTEKERHEPRSFLLVTAEELPRVQSSVARTLVLEFRKGNVDIKRLTECQQKAHLMPYAMTSWLRWVSRHIDEIRADFPAAFRELRTKASNAEQHHKLPEQAAYLQYAMLTASRWMQDAGVLNEESAKIMTDISWDVLTGNITRQSELVQDEDPVNIFLETLETLLIQEKVRIQNRLTDTYVIGNEKVDIVGYLDEGLDYLYMIPGGMWNSIKRYLNAEGSYFPVSKNTLFKMLRNKGLLNVEGEKSSNVVKARDDEGKVKSMRVLQLRITDRLREVIVKKAPHYANNNGGW